jgi:hypothetical protein
MDCAHMPFNKHLFISYAHIDDRPLTGQEKGWITRFHRDLEDRLTMRLGYDAKIWRDERLSGNDVFSNEIVSQFPETALLISVLSPRYVKSDWCKREVEEFCRAAENSGGITVENRSRVVKIVKTPVDLGELPPVMKETIGYDFFVYDDPTTPIEIDPAYGPDMLPLFNRKMAKLAQELADTIIRMEKNGSAAAIASASSSKPVVYLAECGYDRGADRDAIETDLRAHGYTVLPDRQLPSRADDYLRDVTGMLERCQLAVQLVGTDYGMVPWGPGGKSAPVLQNEVAVERSRSFGLPRILSLAAAAAVSHPDQERFIHNLQNDAEFQHGADLIIGDLETVKATIHAALRRLEQPKPAPAVAENPVETADKLAYVICDQRDMDAIKPLRRFLMSAGYRRVRLPLFTDDAAAVRQNHETLLAECDLVVHFYGNGDVRWKASVEADLFKLKAYRSSKPLPRVCTLVGEPLTPDKADMIEFLEPGTVDGTGSFPEDALKDLLKS